MIQYNFRKLILLSLALIGITGLQAGESQNNNLIAVSEHNLQEAFLNPAEEAKPWTFWYWMYGAVSSQGITADLKAMKEIGLEGCYLMSIKDTLHSPYTPKIRQLSPEWWKLVHRSMTVADSLNLKLGIHISDGFALAGGPWIKPEESMQKLVSSAITVRGGRIKDLDLIQPETNEGYYKDIAVYALPIKTPFSSITPMPGNKKTGFGVTSKRNLKITSNNPEDSLPFHDAGKAFRATEACNIDYDMGSSILLRNLTIQPAGNNFQAQRFSILKSEDGIHYQFIKQFTPPRQGWQNTGFGFTFTLPPTEARYIRLSWNPANSEPGSEDLDAAKWKPTLKVNEIQFSSLPKIENWEGKSGLVWRLSDENTKTDIPAEDCFPRSEIIDLSSSYKNGKLSCILPEGEWLILRIGHTSTGQTNATGGGGKGLECDKFTKAAVEKQFNNWFGAFYQQTDSALAHKVINRLHIDSWECGSQNWSENFMQEFRDRRSYDLSSWLPVLCGYPLDNVESSEKVLRDQRATINELLQEVFFKTFQEKAHQNACLISAESVAPTMLSDGMEHYSQVDLPMGEFWLNSPTHDKINDMLDAISGAHIYGKKLIQAEGFTELRTSWTEHPGNLKQLLDRNLAFGMNKLFFHVFVHNPDLTKKPGMTLDGIGLYFQRDQTWWKQGAAFVDYINRCQTLLQYGEPVVDLAVYTGDELPGRSMTPDRLSTILPGIMGKEAVEKERMRQENTGNLIAESPKGVQHMAKILNPADWIDPLRGYKYDSYNSDALQRSQVDSLGALVSPGGLTYKILIQPGVHRMNPSGYVSDSTRNLLNRFKKQGVLIPEVPYQAENFSQLGMEPDLILPAGCAWNHRKGKEGDIYFLANQSDSTRTIKASFRIKNKNASIWDPVNGSIYQTKVVSSEGRSMIELSFEPSQSCFVVFTDSITGEKALTANSIAPVDLTSGWNIELLNNHYKIDNSVLFDWSNHPDDSVKYYSGTARYKNNFRYTKDGKGNSVFLHLGKVCNLATVKINGENCGTAWTFPYRIDITKALKNGLNSIEIECTNTWANALAGSDLGKAPFAGISTNGKYRKEGNGLEEAGLIGPLTLEKRF